MRKYIIPILIITLFSACVKDENKHPVPDIPIYLQYPVCINDVEYIDLSNVYGKVVLPGEGYLENGIIIVNTGSNEFVAYDATCPFEVKLGCSVLPDENSISLVTCSCCGSKFEVNFGAVSSGSSLYPLKKYKTAFDGQCIRVYN